MGTKSNPGKFDCYARAEPDEPIFVLLARDEEAVDLVMEWARRREMAIEKGLRPDSEQEREKIAEARGCAAAMLTWRNNEHAVQNTAGSSPAKPQE